MFIATIIISLPTHPLPAVSTYGAPGEVTIIGNRRSAAPGPWPAPWKRFAAAELVQPPIFELFLRIPCTVAAAATAAYLAESAMRHHTAGCCEYTKSFTYDH